MQETNPLEKELQSWTPRRPSAEIARRLFRKAAPPSVCLRRAQMWHWLTPIAAGVMTLMVVTSGTGRHWTRLGAPDNASFFATLFSNAATSNLQHTYVLSQMDENMEWNIWTHPIPTGTVDGGSSLNFSVPRVTPTNR